MEGHTTAPAGIRGNGSQKGILNMNDLHQDYNTITALCQAGLHLVPIPPIDGQPQKRPGTGWNKPRSANNPGGYSNNPDDFENCQGYNFGLYHGASNTLALDIDDLEEFTVVCEALGIPLPDWLNGPNRVGIKSPKVNRDKLLFRLPDGFQAPGALQFKHDGKVIFELRSGNCQDVIHGRHPEGGAYQLIGNPAAIPEAPEVLLNMLQHWDEWKACFDSTLGIEQEPTKEAPRQPLQGENLLGWRNPIDEFNQSGSVAEVLLRNGYRQKGKDRFIRPGSESGAPGAVIMHNCADGLERVYSHGGDCLNDGFAHDAFDCMRLLEHGGDWNKALNWNPDITKHNQRLYIQDKAKNSQEPDGTENDVDSSSTADKTEQWLLSIWDAAKRFVGIPPAREWLIEGILLMSKAALLAAAGGVGKSFLLLELAYKIATMPIGKATAFLPVHTAFGRLERGGVAVMICAEDDAIEIHNRLASLGPPPDPEGLIVVPLPDAGGNVSLFELDPATKTPVTTQAFQNLSNQLKAMANLTLVVLDPLQALCGGLELNLPQHGQHVCGALAKLAVDTGAAVIASHHFRKGGEIKNPEDAREAIRGSGGLVDGMRSAIALWPATSAEVSETCKRLGLEWQRNRVCKMAVVKANFKADWHIKTLVRGDDGLLSDRGFDLYNATPKPAEIEAKLLEEIELAASKGAPFTRTGENGIHERRHELPAFFHDWGRDKLRNAVQKLLNGGKLMTFKLKGAGKTAAVWLGKPNGVLSVNQAGGDAEKDPA